MFRGVHVRKSGYKWWEFLFPFYYVGSGDCIQIFRLGSKCLYLLSHTAKDKALGTDLFYFKLVKVSGLSKPALQVFLEIPMSNNDRNSNLLQVFLIDRNLNDEAKTNLKDLYKSSKAVMGQSCKLILTDVHNDTEFHR